MSGRLRGMVGRAIEKADQRVAYLSMRRDFSGNVSMTTLTGTNQLTASVTDTTGTYTFTTNRQLLATTFSVTTGGATATASADLKRITPNSTTTLLSGTSITTTNGGASTASNLLSVPADNPVQFQVDLTNVGGTGWALTVTVNAEDRWFGPI